MEMANVQIHRPKGYASLFKMSDNSKIMKRNAMILCPYIQGRTLPLVRAAEILGVNIVDLIDLYNSVGLPNLGASPKGTEPMFRKLVDGIVSLMSGQISRIVLYGSVARGTDTSDSDMMQRNVQQL